MKRILIEQARTGSVHVAVGALLMSSDTHRFLFDLRSYAVEEPAVWGTFGGGVDEGETLTQALHRELWEETGYRGRILGVKPLWISKSPDVHYHNHLVVVPTQYKPKISWESTASRWVDYGHWPKPLHPKVKMLLADPHTEETIRESMKEWSNL
jgi:8-oxo-dGTP pyrophosphatase MutT (NUDIX family)